MLLDKPLVGNNHDYTRNCIDPDSCRPRFLAASRPCLSPAVGLPEHRKRYKCMGLEDSIRSYSRSCKDRRNCLVQFPRCKRLEKGRP